MKHTPGKIYLADQRGHFQTTALQRLSTLSFGDYHAAERGPLGNLLAFNEEHLAGAGRTELPVAQDCYVLLLPITGSIAFSLGEANGTVEVEQIQGLAVAAGSVLHLTNPYEEETISFLHIWLRAEVPASEVPPAFDFEWEKAGSQLLEVISNEQVFSLSIGRFHGREEAFYTVPASAHFFAFVLAGAFEIEGRLLHERDGLGLWEAEEVELEALSNDAIVLVLEVQAGNLTPRPPLQKRGGA